MNTRRTALLLVFIIFGAITVIPEGAFSQRISPGDQPPEQEKSSEDKSDDQEQLILPEKVEEDKADKESQEMYNRARIQKLKADSAAMRVEFEEKISQLKSDSAAMRRQFERRIRALKQKIKDLKKRLNGQQPSKSMDDMEEKQKQPDKKQKEMVLPEDVEKKDKEASKDEQPSATEGDRFNPNTASISELNSIPGLSKRLAERIEWYRREVRPFNSREDLRRVPGIDRETYQKIHTYFHEGPY